MGGDQRAFRSPPGPLRPESKKLLEERTEGFPSARGCRPFFAENCPLDSFPGATNPLNPFGWHACYDKGKEERT